MRRRRDVRGDRFRGRRRARALEAAGPAALECLVWAALLSLLVAWLAALSPAEGALPVERVERPGAGPLAAVELRAESVVRGPEIRLRDIADVRGRDAETGLRLGAVEIGRAPLPGLSRILDLAYIKARVAMREAEAGLVLFEAPAEVRVTTASQRISGAEQVEAVRRELVALRHSTAVELAVQAAALPADLELPAGKAELRVRLPPGAEQGSGLVSAALEACVDGRPVRTVSVPVRVALLEEVLVAARSIPRQRLLTGEDVRVERRTVGAGQETLQEVAAVVGQRARRNIARGESILGPMLERPPAVRRGEVVLLTVEGHGLKAVARGEAREDGTLGQVIRVKNLASGREVYGQVSGERELRVAF